MNKLKGICRIISHPRELRLALSGLAVRLGGDDAFGGLSDEELGALVAWVERMSPSVVVEVGTLFGFTASALARRTRAHVVAVDNFCWNPFGLTPDQHEAFARRVLADSGVELVRGDAADYLANRIDAPESTLVFLDGDHSYEGVLGELRILKRRGVAVIAGHDFGNPSFGVTRAVREELGEPDEVVGMCWLKRLAGR